MQSLAKTAFIINPLSHTVSVRGSDLIRSGAGEADTTFMLEDFSPLPTYVETILKAGIPHVFIEGGDGTIHGVLSAFLAQQQDVDKLPKFTLLSGGMTNLVAAHVGLKRPSPHKISRLVLGENTGTEIRLPLIGVTNPENHSSYYGFLLSTGALPAATNYCVDHVHTQGVGGSAAVRSTLLKVLLGRGPERDIILKPTPLDLDLGATHVKEDHIIAVATTLPKLMIGLKPFWGTGDGDLKITYADGNARYVKRNIARMLLPNQSANASQKLASDGFHSFATSNARLKVAGDIVLDGEFLPKTNTALELFATQPLRFIK